MPTDESSDLHGNTTTTATDGVEDEDDELAHPFDVPDGSGRRVAVVGAGAVGLTAAFDLAEAGASVTVYERGDVGSGSSGRASGILYDAYAEDVDARMAARALARFREFDGTGGFSVTPCPHVAVAHESDEKTAEAIAETAERMRVHGRDVTTTDGAGLTERFGETLRTDDVGTAVIADNAMWTDPASYVEAMAPRVREAGVDLRTETEVGIRTDPPEIVSDDGETERYDAVLVAAGAHTKHVLADAGVSIPMKPYRVQALVSDQPYDGPICYDATEGAYFRPHPEGLLAGDGTEEVEADPDRWDRDGDDWFVEDVTGVLDNRAGYDADVSRAWAGLCTATPDRNPLLGEIEDDVYVATGWHGHGFMWSPASGEAVAAMMLGGDVALDPYDPRRFDGDEEFEVVEGMTVE
ncbi:glycine/d-amino acid oxidase, deaminating [Halogeometricum borinquense DSM 11551]|uniref:Glycine/D-amino acid oxidase, deaminating n=1 Tax=Halogeometricum borinquense (strain ATCC 700274 / DSM 11551 / JCM 10706 / KCTC 4070 / PR3) TaxID=469382 RepID=E4NRG6_HALBP|nr:FAD-binding oxidoreductase [Halogeometricum borinquense]ADQ68007.1 glycine/D-amino acid oxidase, deaminating [Halogeometricum borinquense DSM 11551]ELY24072.1 glycine/d-amino acid oxidase, deaminating [Halogeometricum borinquense DSM 11551]